MLFGYIVFKWNNKELKMDGGVEKYGKCMYLNVVGYKYWFFFKNF